MNPPRLNRRLTLETLVAVADGAGGSVAGWVALGEVWAEVTARIGRERGEAEAAIASVAHRIAVRAAPAGSQMRPKPGQRFRDGPRIYAIRTVSELDGNGRHLACQADEEVAP